MNKNVNAGGPVEPRGWRGASLAMVLRKLIALGSHRNIITQTSRFVEGRKDGSYRRISTRVETIINETKIEFSISRRSPAHITVIRNPR